MLDKNKGMLFEAIVVLLLVFLIFILYVMVTNNGPTASEEWNQSGVIGSTDEYNFGNMFIGSDGTLFTVDGITIHAINTNGHDKWSLDIPYLIGKYRDPEIYGNATWTERGATSYNGTLYIIVMVSDSWYNQELLAISPDGKLLWGKIYTYDIFS